jgi:hypothetical protein
MKRRDPRLWEVPRIWPEGECVIIGGGPSLIGVDMDSLRARRTIAVNMAYKLGDWIDVMFFGDCRFYNWNAGDLSKFAGLKVTSCPQHVDKPGIKVVQKQRAPVGLCTDPKLLAWNLSSGACAVNLATHFGVKRIVLVGFDMKKRDEKDWWHDYYDKPANKRHHPYPRFMKPFKAIAESLKSMRVECVNACPDSALDVFPRVTPEEALC